MPDPAPRISAQVLIVDDEQDHAEVMAEALRRLGHVCTLVHDLPHAKEELQHGSFDLIVTDLVMDHAEAGLDVLAAAKASQPTAETILVTAHGDVPIATKALKAGAYHFIEKPLDLEVFRSLCEQAIKAVQLRQQNTQLRGELDERFSLEGIIGGSQPIHQVRTLLRQVAPSDIPVLVTGESGTGKELVAKALHNHSQRSKRVFKPLNCAGLSESILESELFGHVKGAFTGAERDRQGVFEYADGGTLFLDEIGDMPAAMQAKLLRVLESGEIVRVGANEPRHVNVRLLSATNHDLAKLTKEGKFREDLFFRIRGAHIHLPPLRDRREDVPMIVNHYLDRFSKQMKKNLPGGVDEDAMLTLMKFDWPGNIRQLINVVQNALILCDGPMLRTEHLPPEVRLEQAQASTGSIGSLSGLSLDQIEKQAIRNALKLHNGNREAAARMLGIGERTMYRKLKEYGLK